MDFSISCVACDLKIGTGFMRLCYSMPKLFLTFVKDNCSKTKSQMSVLMIIGCLVSGGVTRILIE